LGRGRGERQIQKKTIKITGLRKVGGGKPAAFPTPLVKETGHAA